jgi:hypothetical protein
VLQYVNFHKKNIRQRLKRVFWRLLSAKSHGMDVIRPRDPLIVDPGAL